MNTDTDQGGKMSKTACFNGAQGRNRTGTGVAPQRILSRWGIHPFSTFSGIYSGQRRTKTTENDPSTAGKRWQCFLSIISPVLGISQTNQSPTVCHIIPRVKATWIVLFLALAGCGMPGEATFPHLNAMPSVKLGEMAHMDSESTPVVFGGRVVVVTSLRWGPNSNPQRLIIRDFDTRTVLFDSPTEMDYICAYVENGTLYVFGVTGNIPGKGHISEPGNSVVMTKTTDLVTWTTPTKVYMFDSDTRGYNLSVTKTKKGYVMAYDYGDDSERPMWKQKFLHSKDLIKWEDIPHAIHKRSYWSAGATIRYYAGWYYLITHVSTGDGRFGTVVSRSPDLVTWFNGKKWMMIPTEGYEGINTSDLDLVEFNGQVYFSYMTGDQKTWSGVALATVNGTEKQVLEEMF